MPDNSEQKRTTARAFGDAAAAYLSSDTHRKGADLEQLASWVDEATRVLDVATGAGHTAGALVEAGIPNVVATDVSRPMVATTVDSFPDVQGVVADAERLPFPTDTFDAVTCRIAAHHFLNPRAFVTEVSRVIRPGGIFAFEDNVAPEDETCASFLNRLETMRDPTHIESYRTSTWHQWIDDAGFSVEETEHLVKTINFESWVERINSPSAEEKEQIQQYLLNAPAQLKSLFEITCKDGKVQSFGSSKVLICAVRD
jgi:ubiquinone/menaquinone biosynthesis C-methylase UbiE